ncbi:MAG TPA: hypothetical protein VFS43_02545 [Polyangiaceae bacterium]|nr:hypothetical protein [Polyangiaceae bacterium]
MTPRAMSVPAEMPDEVTNAPSSTQRARSTQCTRSLCATASAKICLFDVARRPSRSPAFARRAEPVQTDMVTIASGARARKKSSSAGFSSSRNVPMPPGNSKRSSRGASSKPYSASAWGPWSDFTGPGRSATVTMRTWGARAPNISRGP